MLAGGSPADDEVGMLAGGFGMPGGMLLPLLGLAGLGVGTAVLGDDEEKPPVDDGDDGDGDDGDGDDGDGDDGDGDDGDGDDGDGDDGDGDDGDGDDGDGDDGDGDDGDGDDGDGDDGDGDDGDGDGVEGEIVSGTVDKGHVVNAEDHADGVDITGTGTVGATVTVRVEDAVQTTVVGEDGTWAVTFPPGDIATGTYVTPVTVVVSKGVESVTITENLSVDTEAMVTFNANKVGGDGTVNAEEAAGGITLTGKTEAGSTVTVLVGGVTYTAVVTGAGWSLALPASVVESGEYNVTATVTAVDQHGNTATTTGTYKVDTETSVTVRTHDVEGDGVINFVERQDGVTLTGTAEAGASVIVMFGTATRTVTAKADGTWSADFARGEIPLGESVAEVTVVATDKAGNTATATGTIGIDTLVDPLSITSGAVGGNGVVNMTESAQAITVGGLVEAGSVVTVTLAGVTVAATVTNGNWTATFPAGSLPGGTYDAVLTVNATDQAGNTASTSQNFKVDTVVDPFTLNKPVEGDNVISAAEAADGVQLSGTVEAGSRVVVEFGGATRTVTAGANGLWSVTIPASAVAAAEYNDTFSATATDVNGNVSNILHNVRIDTIVNRLTVDGPVEGDDLVNREEASDGITLTGTVEAGSGVMVTFEGTTRAATVDGHRNWSVSFTAAEIPEGEYTSVVTIAATDKVGNTRSITDTFQVDTIPPEAPLIESATSADGGLRAFSTELTDETVEIAQVSGNGTVSDATYIKTEDTHFDEVNYTFTSPIPNGSHLVITASDETGNNTSTLFVLEEALTNVVNVNNPGLDGFNIEGIDLQFAEDSELTLTVAELESLAAHSNTLMIHGGVDDTVTVLGAKSTGESRDVGVRTYDIYSFGDNGGLLIIDESINVVT